MKTRLLIFALIAFFVIPACRLAAGSPSSPAQSNTAPAVINTIFEIPPDPLSISVSLDETHSAEATLPVEGGTLSATAADGTLFTLTVPPDALLNETPIRMTPAASVNAMPFGGEQTYAVQLEPEGLFFNNFATLTITPAQEIPIDQQIFFGYTADGQNLVIAPPVVDSTAISIQLLHFSGYGVTKGLLADIEPVRARIGGDAEKRIQSQVAEALSRERQRQLLGSGESESNLDEIFNEAFKQYEEQVVKPRIAAAGESCAAGRLAVQTLLGFERQKQLLGAGDEGSFGSDIASLMKTVARVCVQEEYEMCAEDHIIHRMIPVWLGLERQYQLLGISGDSGPAPEELQFAKDMAVKCLTFELAFESDANFDAGGGDGYESIVKAKIPLKLNPDELKIKGQSALINDSFEFKASGCSVDSRRGGGTFEAISLIYISDTHSPTDQLGYVRDFDLSYFPGQTSESFTVTCEDSPPYTSPPSSLWSGIFLVLHFPEVDMSGAGAAAPPQPMPSFGGMESGFATITMPALPSGAGYIAKDWELQSGDYLAKKEWIKEDASIGLVESGTLKLYHRPGN